MLDPQVGKMVAGPRNFCSSVRTSWEVLQCVVHLTGGCMVGLMTTSSTRTYATHQATQFCCSQSPCPCVRPLLTHASAGDTQTLKGRSGSVSCRGHCSFPWVLVCTRFVCTFREFLVGVRFDSKSDCTSPTVLLGLLICPWTWGFSFRWDPTFTCQRVFSSKLRFWCFADQHMSFYSANMLDTSSSTATSKQPP